MSTPVFNSGNTYTIVVEPSNTTIIVDNSKQGPQGPAGANGIGLPSDGTAGQLLFSNGGANSYWATVNYVTSTELTNNLASYITTNDLNTTLDGYVQFIDFANLAYSIIPASNGTYSLGNSTHQWKDLYVTGNKIGRAHV